MILAYYRNPSLAEGPQRPTQTPAALPQEPPGALTPEAGPAPEAEPAQAQQPAAPAARRAR